MSHKLLSDLRFVIGSFFTVIGIILLGTWLLGPSDLVEGIHINLMSGSIILLFGIFMVFLAKFFPVKEV